MLGSVWPSPRSDGSSEADVGFIGFSCFNGGKSWHLMGFHSNFMAFPMVLMGFNICDGF